jgi:aminopeptidase N
MISRPTELFPGIAAGCAAALLAASPAAAIDPFFPSFGNDGYDVLHYDLDLEADPVANSLQGVARLSIKATKQLNTFQLDLAGLGVDKVHVDGDRAAFSQANDKLTIEPKRAIPDGRPFEVVIRYGGTPVPLPDPTAPGLDILPLGWLHYKKATYVLSEPVGASTFFPCNDEPTDRATYSISITVPKPYTAVANGLREATEDLGTAQRFRYEMRQPMTTWLATVQINKYKVVEQSAEGVPLHHYITKKVTDEQVGEFLRIPQYMKWMRQLVAPYPFESYGSITVDDPELYYALETQAVSTYPFDFIDRGVIVHELAHQWFGNAMSVAEWRDLWIAEGFATYFEFLFPYRNKPEKFDAVMQAIYDYLVANNVGPAVVENGEQIFSDRTYYRGALSLYALRQQVGEQAFWNIVRAFYARYEYKSVTSADFIEVAVETSRDRSVRKLLNAWLYEQPVPPLPGVVAGRLSRADEGRAIVAGHLARRTHKRH